jgi:hypothetical protein
MHFIVWGLHPVTHFYAVTPKLCLPPLWWGDILFLSCRLSVTQFVSATPLKLLNRISWNLVHVGSKDTICSCAYYQEILIAWIPWELCPFELRNFPKFTTTEAACQRNSSERGIIPTKFRRSNFLVICTTTYGVLTTYQVSWNYVQ